MSVKFETLRQLVGNTPLIMIDYKYKGEKRTLYAKAEYYNFSGSVKDRIALNILEKAFQTQAIKPGDIICETTSGNTGISFCAIGAYLGHKVVIYMPNWLSEERKSIMTIYGAELRLVSKEEGGFLRCLELAKKYAEHDHVFCPLQFDNPENVEAHFLTTAKEIETQMNSFGAGIDAIAAGIGTGGTIMGLNKYFKPKGVKVYPIEPSNSPTLSTGYKVGSHRIQGISDDFIPSILQLNELEKVLGVDDGDSIIMSQKLNRELGLGVGISSGANFLGAVLAQNETKGNVVTIFADDNKKYLSTDLAKVEPVKAGFLTPDIELSGIRAIRGN